MKARRWPVRLAWVATTVVLVVGMFTEGQASLPMNLVAGAAGLVLILGRAWR